MDENNKRLFLVITVLLLFESTSSFLITSSVLDYMKDKLFSSARSLLHSISDVSEEYPFTKGPIGITEEYDFIVVGSGAAGSTIANRLSEIPHWNILLLEAGKPENVFTDIPGVAAMFQLTDYNWGYTMERQEGVCMGMTDQLCAWPRGKALGGTSVINYMIYTRGNKVDFDRWAAQGNPGWSWDEVVPYYIKSENANIEFADQGYHGKGGYLNVQDVPYRTPLAYAFVEAGIETGRRILDYNGADQFGFSTVQATIRKGSRCSAAKAFIKPAEKRRNLRILTLSRATKVLINADTKVAYGVQYLRNEKMYTALARKEVILSGGAFMSPQLLMLSGIGPEEHLQQFDIPVIENLPVGRNLHDHLTFVGLTFLTNDSVSYNIHKVAKPSVVLDYFANGEGPLTSIGGVEDIGYTRTKVSNDVAHYPDVEFIFLGGSITSDGGTIMKDGFRITQDFYDSVYGEINFADCWSIIPMLLHPKSIGYLELRSNNPFDPPKLYGNYYTDSEEHDLNTMVAGIKEIIRLSQTEAFRRYGSILHDVPFPNCAHLHFGTDNYWKCALRTLPPSLHHQVGTCKMGPETDNSAVVSPELKVHGIRRLRVADTSVIPFALSAHTNAPAFMIGEKAADMIKDAWKQYITPTARSE